MAAILTVFAQGLLSFFSPCILPLVPLYFSYLAGGMYETDADGKMTYPRKKVVIHTLCFILGIGFAFVLLGLGMTAIGHFFGAYKIWFTRVGALIMILFGLYQLGFFGKSMTMEQTHRLNVDLNGKTFGPWMALILGFTFSFAWTPCVGPVLTSVLLMASSASKASVGFALLGVYLLGFVLPFLAVGLFAGTVLDFFQKRKSMIQYTVKIGGALLILMGIMTLTGWMNGITSYLSSFGGVDIGDNGTAAETVQETTEDVREEETAQAANPEIPAPDFSLVDQFGKTHTLSDYKGKTVFLNFWATWCGPCQAEMPYIQKVYEDYGLNQEDVIILGIANPKSEEYPRNADVTQEEIVRFLSDNGYTYPVVMDLDGSMFYTYGISAYPTTFMIDVNGNVYGYIPGSLTEDMIRNIIEQTRESVK